MTVAVLERLTGCRPRRLPNGSRKVRLYDWNHFIESNAPLES